MTTMTKSSFGIGTKLILGLGILIGISVVVGGVATLSLLSIQSSSQQLAHEYLPETVASSEVERQTLKLMLEVRGYWLTGEKSYYDGAMVASTGIEKGLETLQALADQYPRLVKLRESLPKAKENYTTYRNLIAETKTNTEILASVVTQGALAAAEFFKNAQNYLDAQEASLAAELRSGARASVLAPRVRKISLIHQSRLVVTTVRQEFLRSMAFREETSVRNALKSLVQVKTWVREMQGLTKQRANLEELSGLSRALETYENEVDRWLEANGRLNELASLRLAAGDGLSGLASGISQAAIEASSHLGDTNTATVSVSLVMITLGLAVSVLLGILVAILLIRSITGPLRLVTSLSGRVIRGDFAIERQDVRSHDELGLLTESFYDMVEGLKAKASLVESIANGVLTNQIPLASDDDGLGKSLQRMQDSLNEILTQVNVAVDQMASGSDQVSTAAQSLSQGATEQASSLEEISASANEIHSQSKQNAENATSASQLAKQASSSAQQGNQQMKDLMVLLEKMTKSSEETKTIVKTIDDIAFQVNLLALNANVEAARAGKYGKGFAVVAEEVRNLAVRSATAVGETTRMVEESLRAIQDVNATAQKTGDQLNGILGNTNKVADFLEEIAASSQEQAKAMGQINGGLDQIDQVTQSNTASAEESASASEELSGQAQQLKVMVSRFQLSDEAYQQALARSQVAQREKHSSRPQAPGAGKTPPSLLKRAQGQTGPKAQPGRPNDILLNDDFDTF